jgi:hypothetical protein
MFASRTLTEHLLRGIVGIGAMIGAVAFAPLGWASLLLVPVGLVALRGCPMCWTIGLVQTCGRASVERARPTPASTGRAGSTGAARDEPKK